tara:strand:- start:826 stop:1263 length:438 start_codon:yes stop_codon:yes gene_type:complete
MAQCYKVVYETPEGLTSAWTIGKIHLSYAKGQETIPEFGKIFVFESEKRALVWIEELFHPGENERSRYNFSRVNGKRPTSFLYLRSSLQIWLCECRGLRERKRMSTSGWPECYKTWWREKHHLSWVKTPVGTMTADSVTLLERVV